ncbi:MAG: helix-turn-helix domain-containing protein [Treponema sp.]|jgi:transcriptional regulator with XRE-family HTH domain|nr:helix-turn-helix domain-containing protein [Treponema sp.]
MSKDINLPFPAQFALQKLGKDINSARRRRRISKAMMAERAGIAVNTLSRIEEGNPSTTMAAWASVLFVLGLTENLQDICDLKNDATGLMLEEEHLPKRIRHKRKIYG